MRCELLLTATLAALANARPVSTHRDIAPRELQYSEIAAAYARHGSHRSDDHKVRRELDYATIAAAYAHQDSDHHDHHGGDNIRRELDYADLVGLSGPPPKPHEKGAHIISDEGRHAPDFHSWEGHHRWDHEDGDDHHGRKGHDHHKTKSHGHSDQSILSLLRNAQPDVATRVLDGIRSFISHVVRAEPEQNMHTHRQEHEHPQDSVVNNIIDFLSKSTR